MPEISHSFTILFMQTLPSSCSIIANKFPEKTLCENFLLQGLLLLSYSIYCHIYIIESHHKILSFVVTDPLHIDGMKGFSVDKVTFILARSNNANLRPIDATNYSWEPSPSLKTVLVFVDDSCSCWPLYEHALLGG